MSFNVGKAIGYTAKGVAWRLAVFLMVALFFSALVSLREWHTSYAPSHDWAEVVEAQKGAWTKEVGEAARAMAVENPSSTYKTAESFYKELLRYVKEDEYRSLVERRNRIREGLNLEAEQRNREFVKKSAELREKIREINETKAEIELLEGLNVHGQEEKEIRDKEEYLKKLREDRATLSTEVTALVTERATTYADFQRQLIDLNSSIKNKEEEIQEVFDAAVSSARPVYGKIAGFKPEYAIRIGDENHWAHIFYLMAWYGLEVSMVLLICMVVVPWLLRLGGDASEPKALRSSVTERIKGWLGNILGPYRPNSRQSGDNLQ